MVFAKKALIIGGIVAGTFVVVNCVKFLTNKVLTKPVCVMNDANNNFYYYTY